MIVVGIDPGMTGAVAWWMDGQLTRVEDMPVIEVAVGKGKRKQLQPSLLANMLYEGSEITRIYLEHVQSMSGEGAVGAFSFGRGFGMIEGIIACMQTPYVLVRPAKWKGALGVPADKGGARALACRRFPAFADRFARIKDDGRAEAALIALYGASL